MPDIEDSYKYLQTSFNFRIIIDGITDINEGNFQEVSGIKVNISFEEIKEGGENTFTRRFPKPPTYQNLILKRGVLKGSPLIKWATTTFETFKFMPKNVILQLMDENQKPVMSWTFSNAYPVGISTGDFNAMENKILVETLELAYDSFTAKTY